jgi:hypothetical protein
MAGVVTALPPEAQERALSSVAFTSAPQIQQLGERGQQLIDAAFRAFTDGVGATMLTAAGLLAVVAIAVWLVAPKPGTATDELRVVAEVPEPEVAVG